MFTLELTTHLICLLLLSLSKEFSCCPSASPAHHLWLPPLLPSSSRVQLGGSFLKSRVAAPVQWAIKTVSNGSRVNAFNVVNPDDNTKFETLSYLPPLTDEETTQQIDYLLRNGWIPAIVFDKSGVVSQTACTMPGYYDGRYWSMWKLPLFGAKDSSQVLEEVLNAKTAYPNAFIRVIGFDNVKLVQVVSFIVKKPGQP